MHKLALKLLEQNRTDTRSSKVAKVSCKTETDFALTTTTFLRASDETLNHQIYHYSQMERASQYSTTIM